MNHDNSPEIIIPAIMPFTDDDIERMVKQVVGRTEYVQIDLMDGDFVPQASWPFEDGIFSLPEIDRLKKVITENPQVKFEVDLMVTHALSLAPVLVQAGVHRVVFHHKTIDDPVEIIQFAEEFPDVEIGMALHTDESPEVLIPFKKVLGTIQCMGIEKVGYQEQGFSEKSLQVIAESQKLFPEIPIQVDGGVNLETITQISDAGAYRFVAGSAIFTTQEPGEAIGLLAQKI